MRVFVYYELTAYCGIVLTLSIGTLYRTLAKPGEWDPYIMNKATFACQMVGASIWALLDLAFPKAELSYLAFAIPMLLVSGVLTHRRRSKQASEALAYANLALTFLGSGLLFGVGHFLIATLSSVSRMPGG